MTTTYANDWKKAKTQFEAATGKKKPSKKFLGVFKSKGSGVASALKKVDDAGDLEVLKPAYQKFYAAKKTYVSTMEKQKKEEFDSFIKLKIGDLIQALDKITNRIETDINKQSKALKPTGKMVPVQLLRRYDLMASTNLVNIQVGPMWVEAYIEMDKKLEALILKGKEGVRIETLGEAANKIAQQYKKEMVAAAEKIDKDITQLIVSSDPKAEENAKKKIKEVENVLETSRKKCEKQMTDAVEAQWKKALARKQALKQYRKTVAIGITASSVNIVFNAAHIVATGGVTWLGVVSMAKGVVDLSSAISDGLMKIDDIEEDLGSILVKLHKIATAKREKWYQLNPTMKKVAIGAAELAAWNSYALFKSVPSYTRADSLVVMYKGRISEQESNIDNFVGKLNRLLDRIRKAEKEFAKKSKDIKKKTKIEDQLALMKVAVMKLLDKVRNLVKALKKRLTQADGFDLFLDKLKQFDIYQPKIMKTGECEMYATSIGGLASNITMLVQAV